MKFTHSYNAPALPVMPEEPNENEARTITQVNRDLVDMMAGQLPELGKTILEYIRQHAGVPFLIEWSDPDETPVDPQTVKVTLSVDVKRYHAPKKEESKTDE